MIYSSIGPGRAGLLVLATRLRPFAFALLLTGCVTVPPPNGSEGVAQHARFLAQPQLNHRLMETAMLAAVRIAAQVNVQRLGRLRTHQRGVVPGQLRDRLGQFLQPAIVGKAAIENRRIGFEDNFQIAVAGRRNVPLVTVFRIGANRAGGTRNG